MENDCMGKTLIDVCKNSNGRKNFTSVHRFIWPFYIKNAFDPVPFGWKEVMLNRNNREWYSTFQYLSNNANKIFDNKICKIYRKDSYKQFYLLDKYSKIKVKNSFDAICEKFDVSPYNKSHHFYKQNKNECDWSYGFELKEKCYVFDDNCIQWLIKDKEPENLSVLVNKENNKKDNKPWQQYALNGDALKVVYSIYSKYDISGPVIIKKEKQSNSIGSSKNEEEKSNYYLCEINETGDQGIKIDIDESRGWKLLDGNQVLINPVLVKFDVTGLDDDGNLDVNVYNCFRLPMCDYEMHIYNGKVGFLFINCINLRFDEYMEIEKMKMINDYGRRVEIPYIPTSGYGITADKLGIVSLNGNNNSFYYNEENYVRDFQAYIEGYNNGINESTHHFYKPASFLSNVVFDTNYATVTDCVLKYLDVDKNTEERMFAMTLVNIPSLCERVKKIGGKEQDKAIENLYPVIFNDTDDASCQNTEMQNKLFKEAGNYRWTDWGTLHSITQYSFACITSIEWAFDSVALPFINIYTYLCSIVLAQRYLLLDFADKYTDIIIKGNKIGTLIKDYAIFKNELLLTELSTQEQGIEIYRKMRKQMLVDSELEELESQMSYLNESVAYEFNNKMNFLTYYGVVLSIVLYFEKPITKNLNALFEAVGIKHIADRFTEFFKFESNFNFYLLLIGIIFLAGTFIHLGSEKKLGYYLKSIKEFFVERKKYCTSLFASLFLAAIVFVIVSHLCK